VKYGAHLSLIDVLAPMLGRPLEQIRQLEPFSTSVAPRVVHA
jgi:hypothetical protein